MGTPLLNHFRHWTFVQAVGMASQSSLHVRPSSATGGYKKNMTRQEPYFLVTLLYNQIAQKIENNQVKMAPMERKPDNPGVPWLLV